MAVPPLRQLFIVVEVCFNIDKVKVLTVLKSMVQSLSGGKTSHTSQSFKFNACFILIKRKKKKKIIDIPEGKLEHIYDEISVF